MTNIWSLLYDELNMDDNNIPDYTELDDGMRPWGHSDYEFLINNNMNEIINNSPATPWKYNEEEIVKELLEYIRGTYNQHYSQNKFQATEFIIDGGHGDGFCIGNIMKYAQRYGNKDGYNRKDLMKVLHYAIIQLHVHDQANRG